MTNDAHPGPLSGLRVLALSDETGQFCGKLMGDLGADVIKIEPPGGQNTRSVGPFYKDIPHPERSLSFWHYNTSKRGITLNLESTEGINLPLRVAPQQGIGPPHHIIGANVTEQCAKYMGTIKRST